MRRRITLITVENVDITADETVAAGAGALWAIFSLLGMRASRLRPAAALTGGFLAVVLHFFAEIWHHMGHARAARRVGHPMERLDLWGVIGTSVYPADEGPLPDEVHVKRALGGPRASAVLTLAAGIVALLARPRGGIAGMASTIFALDNLLVFTLGALLPLRHPETDGMTLLRHAKQRNTPMVVIKE